MTRERVPRGALPEPVRLTLDDFRRELDLDLHLWGREEPERRVHLYPAGKTPSEDCPADCVVRTLTPRQGPEMELEIRSPSGERTESLASLLCATLQRAFEFAEEVRFFTYEVSERYEEINLLYSISETLGSILRLDEAARVILEEVCDVLGARRGSLWVLDSETEILRVVASVGEEGLDGPLSVDDPSAVTSRVFREGRPLVTTRGSSGADALPDIHFGEADSFLSVPIRYTPPAGSARTVGVINLIGRRSGGRFTASDQKLLSAIASQVGAALENNRLIQESLARERVSREMELAHDLQMKLLPDAERFEGAEVAARVEPADSVGGDFYHLIQLPGDRAGVMIGDVSSHGFPAALIMALSMSAASIYASEFGTPAQVIHHVGEALREELETTEMYLSLFYGVLDPERGELTYANAGHPHAFQIRGDGVPERLGATAPPVGIAPPRGYAQERRSWQAGTDLLLLFTDGLSDTLAVGEVGSGEEEVLRATVKRRGRPPREIVDALFRLELGIDLTIPADDRTALVLRA